MPLRKIVFSSIWLILVTHCVLFTINLVNSASDDFFQSDLDLIANITVYKWEGINPIIIALFFVMGLFPLIYGAFILFDRQEESISPYPFFIASCGLGAFALLPYFALRKPQTGETTVTKKPGVLLKLLDSRFMAIVISIHVLVFLVWGVVNGDWQEFINQWHTSQFVHITSLDFCLLSVLLPIAILKDDMKLRGIEESKLFWLAVTLPLFGSLIYWCLRPPIKAQDS